MIPGDGGVADRPEPGRGHGVHDEGDAAAVTTTAGDPPTGTVGARRGADGSVDNHADVAAGPPDERRRSSTARGAHARHIPLRDILVLAALWAVIVVPLAVAVVALAGKHWYPGGDLAQAELRLRSFWAHPPLVGAAGRIGTLQTQGNHPGPLMFWEAWPGYWILGRSSWALLASVATVNALTVAAILAVAYRRGRLALAAGMAVVVALLLQAYGASVLVQPWNPSMPLLPWFLFLVLVWSVLCGDLLMLPLAVVAGSYCVQSHVGYTALVGGLVVVMVVGAALDQRRVAGGLRRFGGWLAAAIGVGVLVWIPPVIDQIRHKPGNLRILYDYFAHPADKVLGVVHGARLILVQLDPFGGWLIGRQATTAPILPGIVLLLLWVAGVVVAWQHRHAVLLRLHVLLAATLVLEVASAARIFGFVFVYLVKWAWGTTALLVLATVWSLGLWVADRIAAREQQRARSFAPIGVAVAVLASTCVFAVSAASTDVPGRPWSRTMADLAAPTAAHLDRKGSYLVEWQDPIALGANGFGMILEMERRGFHVGALPQYRAAVEPHRVMTPRQATQSLLVITGTDSIAAWRATPGVRMIAYSDLRTSAQRSRYDQLKAAVTAELRASGKGNLVPTLESSLVVLGLQPGISPLIGQQLGEMVNIGLPTAVFLGPPALNAPAPARA